MSHRKISIIFIKIAIFTDIIALILHQIGYLSYPLYAFIIAMSPAVIIVALAVMDIDSD